MDRHDVNKRLIEAQFFSGLFVTELGIYLGIS